MKLFPDADPADLATEALRLRAWALPRLLRDVHELPPAASPTAWRLFLQAERCAGMLEESLTRTGQNTRLEGAAAETLRSAAIAELRGALSVRAELTAIAGIARSLDCTVLVLKGTVDVAEGATVRVADVDVLARPADARRLAEALDERGFMTAHFSSRQSHLPPRYRAHALSVEVHSLVYGFEDPETVPYDDSQPLAGFEPLRRLAPHHHAWTILNQATSAHPDRRIRIRDLYLLRTALERATPEGMTELRQRVMDDVWRDELEAILRRVERGSDDLRDRHAAARIYLGHSRSRRTRSSAAYMVFQQMALDFAATGIAGNLKRRRRISGSRPLLQMVKAGVGLTAAAAMSVLMTRGASGVARRTQRDLHPAASDS